MRQRGVALQTGSASITSGVLEVLNELRSFYVDDLRLAVAACLLPRLNLDGDKKYGYIAQVKSRWPIAGLIVRKTERVLGQIKDHQKPFRVAIVFRVSAGLRDTFRKIGGTVLIVVEQLDFTRQGLITLARATTSALPNGLSGWEKG